MNIAWSSLQNSVGAKLGEGGFGYVNRLDGRPVPGDPREMVIKRLKPTVDPKHVGPVLQGMRDAVAFRDRLAPADRQYLDTITVWPVAMVTDKGADVGCVMPLIPPDFFETLPTGKEPREIGTLLRTAQARATVGSTEPGFDDDILRLVILAKLAGAIEFLHSHGIVFGDLNPRNEVFRFNPPSVLLLDCDATAHVSDPTRADRQGHFPFWTPPEIPPNSTNPQSLETDVFKLALAFAKALKPGPGASQRRVLPKPLPAIVSRELESKLAMALDPDPAHRPTVGDLRTAAANAVNAIIGPPVIVQAALDRIVMLRGRDVIVSWAIQSGTPYTVELVGPDGARIAVPNGATSYAVRVGQAGPVSLSATTKYATTSVVVGHVDCYELPPFNVTIGNLTPPLIPALPVLPIPNVLRHDITVPIPTLSAADEDVLEELMAISATAPSAAGLADEMSRAYAQMQLPQIGAQIIGSFPVPQMNSLIPAAPLADLRRQLTDALTRPMGADLAGLIKDLRQRVARS